ncbi:hypothetical protein [uncultured Streptococcus sp.]|uniref:hypothetical protein n=1 Tax=uncultured Streptococcus sp. TaxID=83427 RepID=UPI002591F8DF|nr:hypothetical protein [uncultured Streptococcus sp.]
MSNLQSFDNIFANLSESAYTNRPLNFPTKENSNNIESFNFSDDVKFKGQAIRGGKNLPNDGKVYLQPDRTGKLTDKKAGYNSYFVTDKPTVKESKETYFVTRGSDGISIDNLNDWVNNNANFTLFNSYIPQAKLAEKAMESKIKELPQGAVMNVTGHSLGTMVSIQGVANLPADDIDKIGKVVLFQGPDARSSIEKMSTQAQANIAKLEAEGKIDYYINPFDIVSMLNRNKKGVNEIGNVHYLMPLSYTTTFDTSGKYGSSHDFGQYQFNPDGTLKLATVKDNPEIFEAGIRLSRLIDHTMAQVAKALPGAGVSLLSILSTISGVLTMNPTTAISAIVAVSSGKLTYDQAKSIYEDFTSQYNGIISDTQKASRRNSYINNLRSRLSSSSGGEKIKLRSELVAAVADEAQSFGQQYESLVRNAQQETEDEIDGLVCEVSEGSHGIAHYLSYFEVESMIQSFQKSKLWDASQAQNNIKEAQEYRNKLEKFSTALVNVSENIQAYDGAAGKGLFEVKLSNLAPWDLHF